MRRRRWWTAGAALAAVLVLAGALPALGLGRLPVVASVLPARSALTATGALAALVLLATAASARWRRAALPLGLALVVGAAASAAVLLQRGLDDPSPAAAGLRVLSWNTNGHLVPVQEIARLAVRERADVVVLPETDATGPVLARAFAATGFTATPQPAPVAGEPATTVLVRADLGPFDLAGDRSPEPDRSAVLVPRSPGLPRIAALHAVIPAGPGSVAAWSADLDWATRQCTDPDTVVVGDFNTSLDGIGTLGDCTDAAALAGAAAVGSWPTALPTLLGMPLDHVLTGRDWVARSFTVLTDEDRSGARHRPVLAVLVRR